jgi:GPH family glycoside/pentoside/hexuronide:cation symporter
MLFSQIGVSICLVMLFSIPAGVSDVMKYAWFFVFYVAINAIFYTANNVALSALTALITKNTGERVELGVFRFAFVMLTQMLVSTTGVSLSNAFGWQTVAILFAIIALIVNTISVFSFKELPEEMLMNEENISAVVDKPKAELNLLAALKILVKNKFYIIMLLMNIMTYLVAGAMGAAIYYFTYNMGDENLYSFFVIAMMLPMLLGLALTPQIVKKFGLYRTNLIGFAGATVFRGLLVVFGTLKIFPLMLVSIGLSNICAAPLTADGNALIAAISDYTYKKEGIRLDGSMFSCTSMGVKVGNALGTGMCGWLLAAGGFDADLAVQSQTCLNMLTFLFLWLPLILYFIITVLNYFLKVEQANKELDEAAGK